MPAARAGRSETTPRAGDRPPAPDAGRPARARRGWAAGSRCGAVQRVIGRRRHVGPVRLDVAEMQEPGLVALSLDEADRLARHVGGLGVLLFDPRRQAHIAHIPARELLAIGPVGGDDVVVPRIVGDVAMARAGSRDSRSPRPAANGRHSDRAPRSRRCASGRQKPSRPRCRSAPGPRCRAAHASCRPAPPQAGRPR